MRQHLELVRRCVLYMAQVDRTKVDLLGVAVSLVGLGDTKNGLDSQLAVLFGS